MDVIKHAMSNKEIQDCIIQTETMINHCPPNAERMKYLNEHFKKLIEIQFERAAKAQSMTDEKEN